MQWVQCRVCESCHWAPHIGGRVFDSCGCRLFYFFSFYFCCLRIFAYAGAKFISDRIVRGLKELPALGFVFFIWPTSDLQIARFLKFYLRALVGRVLV